MREGGNVTSIQINGLHEVAKVARFLLYGANLFGAHMSTTQRHPTSAGAKFRQAVAESQPLQVVGAITAYAAKMAEQTGFKAVYLSGGGVAANSLGIPDLGISTMEDVLIDARRITDAVQVPLMVDIDTGWVAPSTSHAPFARSSRQVWRLCTWKTRSARSAVATALARRSCPPKKWSTA